MKKNSILLAFLILISFTNFYGQQSVKIGLLKYKGGGTGMRIPPHYQT
jgi:hypothetical protein